MLLQTCRLDSNSTHSTAHNEEHQDTAAAHPILFFPSAPLLSCQTTRRTRRDETSRRADLEQTSSRPAQANQQHMHQEVKEGPNLSVVSRCYQDDIRSADNAQDRTKICWMPFVCLCVLGCVSVCLPGSTRRRGEARRAGGTVSRSTHLLSLLACARSRRADLLSPLLLSSPLLT